MTPTAVDKDKPVPAKPLFDFLDLRAQFAPIRDEIMAAVTQTKGRRLILANGCSVPDDTPEEWLHAARQMVDNLR